mgnify:CR=1 FL=1
MQLEKVWYKIIFIINSYSMAYIIYLFIYSKKWHILYWCMCIRQCINYFSHTVHVELLNTFASYQALQKANSLQWRKSTCMSIFLVFTLYMQMANNLQWRISACIWIFLVFMLYIPQFSIDQKTRPQ